MTTQILPKQLSRILDWCPTGRGTPTALLLPGRARGGARRNIPVRYLLLPQLSLHFPPKLHRSELLRFRFRSLSFVVPVVMMAVVMIQKGVEKKKFFDNNTKYQSCGLAPRVSFASITISFIFSSACDPFCLSRNDIAWPSVARVDPSSPSTLKSNSDEVGGCPLRRNTTNSATRVFVMLKINVTSCGGSACFDEQLISM